MHIGASERIQKLKGRMLETQLPVEHTIITAENTRYTKKSDFDVEIFNNFIWLSLSAILNNKFFVTYKGVYNRNKSRRA